jgi:hypothetical protein
LFFFLFSGELDDTVDANDDVVAPDAFALHLALSKFFAKLSMLVLDDFTRCIFVLLFVAVAALLVDVDVV